MQLTHSCTKRLGKASSHSSTLPKSIPGLKTACTYHENKKQESTGDIPCTRCALATLPSSNNTLKRVSQRDYTISTEQGFLTLTVRLSTGENGLFSFSFLKYPNTFENSFAQDLRRISLSTESLILSILRRTNNLKMWYRARLRGCKVLDTLST